jgi:hypothetical protein
VSRGRIDRRRGRAQQPAAKPAADQPAPPEAGTVRQPVNARVELAITDQVGTGELLKESVTMLVADRARPAFATQRAPRHVHADAQPHVFPSGAIRLSVGLEYTPSVPISVLRERERSRS